jgi:hypothetical protein
MRQTPNHNFLDRSGAAASKSVAVYCVCKILLLEGSSGADEKCYLLKNCEGGQDHAPYLLHYTSGLRKLLYRDVAGIKLYSGSRCKTHIIMLPFRIIEISFY